MSREAVARYFVVYSAIAVGLALLWTLATPGMADWRWAAIIGQFLGAVVTLLLLPGILPLIWWAFGRFRAEKAGGPLSVWTVLAVAFIPLATAGGVYDGSIQPGRIQANISGLFSGDQATFVREVKASCVQRQNQQSGYTEQQFDTFCQCSADAILNQMTVAQFNEAMSSRSVVPPPWLHDIAVRVAPACQRLALGR